jgi:uncharacterized membrane protein YccC
MAEGSIYRLDWSQVNLRAGVRTVLVVIGVAVVLILFGALGITVGLAALFVMIADQPGSLRSRLLSVISFTIVGSLLAFAGAWAGTTHALIAGLLMSAIVYLATVAAALGKPAAVRGLLMAIWVVLALSLSSSVDAPAKLSLAFLVGGLLAGVVVLVFGLLRPSEKPAGDQPPVISTLVEQKWTPLGQFAVIRGLASGFGTYLGIVLFPDFPIWVVIAVLVILREERGATFQIGLLRTAGTLLGVIGASATLAIIGDSEAVVVAAFLASGFGMIALQKVNYAVFTLFLTAMLVFALHVAGDDAIEGGVARLLATLVGVAIAFVAIFVSTRSRVAL